MVESRPVLSSLNFLASTALCGDAAAERVGFEPTVPLRVHWISSPAQSATLSPLRFANGGPLMRGRMIVSPPDQRQVLLPTGLAICRFLFFDDRSHA